MKNIATNTLSYTGIVTLSQYIGTKKIELAQIHNTGGSSLFSFLADCLRGNFDYAKVNYPAKIKLLEQEVIDVDSHKYNYNSLSGFIFLRTPPELGTVPEGESSSGQCRVKYSFMIPRDLIAIIANEPSGSRGLGLGLYSRGALESEPENFAAFCLLTELSLSRNNLMNASLLVDWELIISNANN